MSVWVSCRSEPQFKGGMLSGSDQDWPRCLQAGSGFLEPPLLLPDGSFSGHRSVSVGVLSNGEKSFRLELSNMDLLWKLSDPSCPAWEAFYILDKANNCSESQPFLFVVCSHAPVSRQQASR